MKIILDIETTRVRNEETGKGNPSPYDPLNKLVTVQWKNLTTNGKEILIFDHKEHLSQAVFPSKAFSKLQELFDSATQIIGHNLKFDVSWLLECGFELPKGLKLYDTMIFEYICQKGLKQPLALSELAKKYNLPLKLDILEEYWNKGVNTDEIPIQELREYALQDLEITEALYLAQRERYRVDTDVQYLWPAIELTNQALEVIIEMERNGCHIDLNALKEVEDEYVKELTILDRGIHQMVNKLMGDTPINLSSPDDMCKLLYGFVVNDKNAWSDIFGIGTSERNGVKKRKYPKRMSPNELRNTVKDNVSIVYRTDAEQCPCCYGRGKIRKVKKDLTEYKKENICVNCDGNGIIYNPTSKCAGLRLKPISSQYATAAGFAADKKVIDEYLSRESLDDEVKAFLRALQRQSAITTYLGTFVEGIKKNVRQDLLLHTSLNQCITATGRLSSSNPNFQNLPRGSTFPVRKAICSRFVGGNILEVDFAGLEYRVAVMLAECEAGLTSILEGKDRHQVTAEIIFGKKKSEYSKEEWKEVRQEAKAHTFKPLYFGESGTEAEQTYYKAFMNEHVGIKQWHQKLCNEAVSTGQIKTPTGRIFAFPNAKRKQDGKVQGQTQIVNYPVQSVATADIIWIVVYEIYKEMKRLGLKSKLILQVHDAVLADVHPEETQLMIDLFKKVFDKTHELLYSRYKYTTKVPISWEMSLGPSWGNKKEVIIGKQVA